MAFAAIQVKGEKEFRKGIGQMKEAVTELKEAHQSIGKFVIESARPTMPFGSVPPHFVDSWKASKLKSGVRVYSRLPYAEMLELGGKSFWKPKGGAKYSRVPMGDGEFRMMRPHTVWKKPRRGKTDGYYIGAAIKREHAHIVRLYEEAIKRIGKKYGVEVDI